MRRIVAMVLAGLPMLATVGSAWGTQAAAQQSTAAVYGQGPP
jgi:hypothetical protein